jgi:thiol-disulfide isomerase/thioredoxin
VSRRVAARTAAHAPVVAFAELLSGRAEAPGCALAPWCPSCRRRRSVGSALYPRAPARRLITLQPGGSSRFHTVAHALVVAFAELLSGRAEAPGCVLAPWCPSCRRRRRRVGCALYPRAPARRLITLPHGGSSRFHTVAHALVVAFAELLSGRAEAPGCVLAPWCPSCRRRRSVGSALYPRAPARRLITLPHGGSSHSAQVTAAHTRRYPGLTSPARLAEMGRREAGCQAAFRNSDPGFDNARI